jgi:hypothetical protein
MIRVDKANLLFHIDLMIALFKEARAHSRQSE